MHVHFVFVTKYRREVFTKEILDDLRPMFSSVCTDFESELVEFDGEDDHVHLLVNYPPKVSVSNLVNSLKGVSSGMIRKKNYPSIQKKTMGRSALVAQLLCWQLRRRTHCSYPPVHRTAADSTLKSKARTALPSAFLTPP